MITINEDELREDVFNYMLNKPSSKRACHMKIGITPKTFDHFLEKTRPCSQLTIFKIRKFVEEFKQKVD
jgi:hypothetical protein